MRDAEDVSHSRAAGRLLVLAVVSSVAVVVLASLLIYSVFFATAGSSLGSSEPRAMTPTGRPITVAIVRTPGGSSEWRTYARAIKRMSDATGRPMRVRYVQDRGEIAGLWRSHEVDAGFLCTYCYLDLADKGGVSLVAVPRIAGQSKDAAVLVVRAADPYRSLTDLAGHRVGVTEPTSLAGYRYLYWLANRERVDVARSMTVIRGDSQEQNVRALLARRLDAVVVNRSQTAPLGKADLRIISQSPEYGMPPFVTGSTVSTATRDAMKQALLSIRPSPNQTHAVVEGFSAVTPGDYVFARTLLRFSITGGGSK